MDAGRGRVYNPYCRGGRDRDRRQGARRRALQRAALSSPGPALPGHVVRALRAAGTAVSLARLVELSMPGGSSCWRAGSRARRRAAGCDYLDSLDARQLRDLAGVRDRLAILIESDVGRWLDPRPRAVTGRSARRGPRAGGRLLRPRIRPPPAARQMLGAAIVQDLQTIVASLQARPVPTLVADRRVLGRGGRAGREAVRSRPVGGLQPVARRRRSSPTCAPGGERLLEQVMGNLAMVIAHRQVVPDSAELIAGLAGTTGAWHVSRHSDGRTTRTRQREAVLDPGEVMNLPTGWAAAIVLGRAGSTRITHISAPVRSS